MGERCERCIARLAYLTHLLGRIRAIARECFDPAKVREIAEDVEAATRGLEELGCVEPISIATLKRDLKSVVEAAEANNARLARIYAELATNVMLFAARDLAETCQGE